LKLSSKWWSYSELEKYENVLIVADADNIIDGYCYAIEMNLYLKNLTNYYPNKIKVKMARMWDTSDSSENDFNLEFYNYVLKFVPFTIDENMENACKIYFIINSECMKKLIQTDYSDKKLNIIIDLEYKNSFNIKSSNKLRGVLNIKKIKQDNDLKLELKPIHTYNDIEKIEEE